jgi:hypothetical protein
MFRVQTIFERLFNNINRNPNILLLNNLRTIEALRSFEKPDSDFLNDKECLICLESMDLETNQLVKLPCGCANSAYHIPCIIQLLESGENKNFCPHCKTKYTIFLQQVVLAQHLPNNNLLLQIEQAYQTQQFSYIMRVHILSNSITNVINICVIRGYPSYNTDTLFPVLLLFYFLKVFLNICVFLYLKSDIYKIEVGLVCSYIYQAITFGWLSFALSRVKNESLSIILFVNNLLFGLADIAFRMFVEYRMNNRVIADI